MSNEFKPNVYINIPDHVRACNKIKAGPKLLFGAIKGLCAQEGYCWANNHHLAQLCCVNIRTIKRYILSLRNNNLIKVEFQDKTFNSPRTITILSPSFNKCLQRDRNDLPPGQKCPTPRDRNDPHNSKVNTKENIIIATPGTEIVPPPRQMPAGGNNNVHNCLEEYKDLTPGQKQTLSKHPEPLVKEALRYTYHPTTKLQGEQAQIKTIQHFIKNPSLYEEKMKNIDKPQPKSMKEAICGRFKRGNLYNGYEFTYDDAGVLFIYPNGIHQYSVKWKDREIKEKWEEYMKKVGVEW